MFLYLLDVGTREYGDCIIVHNDEKKVLIDGAHKGDSALLKKQMKGIFNLDGPYHFDLLVLTHLHDDHIGCLPELIKNGDVTASKCLLMDPSFRWKAGDNDSIVANDPLVDALLEEDHSFLSDAELEQFLLDSAKLVDRYKEMIEKLKQDSDKVMLFKGVDADDYKPLEAEFKSLGMQVLGPTKKQLKITKDALLGAIDTLTDHVRSDSFVDSAESDVDRYRAMFRKGASDSQLLIDAAKNKGSINNESIVLKFKSKAPNSWTALVAADMQFAVPEVDGLDDEMKKLLDKVNDKGPYDFIKTSHHTSYNGLDETMLDNWLAAGTQFYGHSGGLHDDHHPEPGVLDFLKDRKDQLTFVRTDRNGLIRVGLDEDGDLSMSITKGDFNSFTKNKKPASPNDQAGSTGKKEDEKKQPANGEGIFRYSDGSQVKFAAEIPEDRPVRIIIEIDGEKKN